MISEKISYVVYGFVLISVSFFSVQANATHNDWPKSYQEFRKNFTNGVGLGRTVCSKNYDGTKWLLFADTFYSNSMVGKPADDTVQSYVDLTTYWATRSSLPLPNWNFMNYYKKTVPGTIKAGTTGSVIAQVYDVGNVADQRDYRLVSNHTITSSINGINYLSPKPASECRQYNL